MGVQCQIRRLYFNPTATTRNANIQWMYTGLEHSHRALPQVLRVNLEHHDKLQDIICFDFVPALLSLLQDESLMVTENLVINKDYPMLMYFPSHFTEVERENASRNVSLRDSRSAFNNSFSFPTTQLGGSAGPSSSVSCTVK